MERTFECSGTYLTWLLRYANISMSEPLGYLSQWPVLGDDFVVVHRLRCGARAGPGGGDRRWLESQFPGGLAGYLLQPRRFHPGHVHDSQDGCHPLS